MNAVQRAMAITKAMRAARRIPMRDRLPYGKWTCEDGREVLFNRQYKPIWQRRPGQLAAVAADPDEWVKYVRQEWFYRDPATPERNKSVKQHCEAVLVEWGV